MKCAVEDCEKDAKNGKNCLCAGHEHRLRRYGSPTGTPEPKQLGVCAVDGCERGLAGGGFCRKHYKRFRKYGDPLGGGHDYGSARDFMRSLVDSETDECIPWPFGRNKDGYGRINWEGTPQGAHVVACELANGPKPSPKHEACHSCGNGSDGCVNPGHLYWGTRKQNVADAIKHGTAFMLETVERYGERSPVSKFSDAVVDEIRARIAGGERQIDLAVEFGMSKTHINRIWKRLGRTIRPYAANDNEPLRAAA